jgi:NADH pyrophosphatase NudC (nudix superfamily)
MKNIHHPPSKKHPEPPKDLNLSNQRFDESSIERRTSKESWSKLLNSDLEILNQLKSPSVKFKPVESKDLQNILNEMQNLKLENQILRKKLEGKNRKNFKSLSRARARVEKNGKLKHCKTCAQLLSRGFTTRFCPTHGHSFKLLSSASLI